ncbi:hypothetical protein TKK_0008364 [Trichogramma kaykai]|uniref:G-protein coupled receptors family 1 profile domain-containing protein n=1 Tax=Trichogramma kaykai TaxID=54128 RepID=A0ABD2X6I7_9HYME
MPTEASVGGPLQRHRHRRHRQRHQRREDKQQDPPMLQPPVSLLEMASLRLPDSDEFDLERRRGQAAVAAAAAEATRQSSQPHPSVVSTSGGIVVGGVGAGGGGLTALGELRNLVGSRAELLADYVNGSLQDLFVLASTHGPGGGGGGGSQSMSPTELGSGASGGGVGGAGAGGLSLGGLVDPTSAVVDDDFVLQALFNATTSGVNNLSLEHVSDRYYRHSVAMSVVYFVAYCLVFVVGLIGNSFVIAVVYRSPRMRTVTNFFIVNLAVADVLVIVFCLPATLMSNIFVRE